MDKPEIGLKKIDFNMIINDDEIDDMNNDKVVQPSDNLTDDDHSNIEDHEIQQKQTNCNSFTLLLITYYN